MSAGRPPMDPLQELTKMAEDKGGSLTMHQIKNEQGETVHGFATMSMPLRKDHWIYQKAEDGFGSPPPMPLRMGAEDHATLVVTTSPANDPGWATARHLTLNRRQMADLIRSAGKYAVRSATMHGVDMDFDPDAMLQNLVVGFLGYWTATGLTSDEWDNPKEPWTPGPPPAQPESTNGENTVQATPQV